MERAVTALKLKQCDGSFYIRILEIWTTGKTFKIA